LSNDYDVATKLKPEQSVVDEFVCSRKELSVEGKLGVGDGNVIINRRMSSGFQALAEIYGPFVAEDDDIAEALVATIPAPRWLLQIVVPAGSQDDVDIALSLANISHVVAMEQFSAVRVTMSSGTRKNKVF